VADFRKKLKRCGPVSVFAASVLILAVLAGAGWLAFGPKQDFSAEENRVLETAPRFSPDAVLDGSFMQSAENFAGDQFPLRTRLVSLSTSIQLLFGKRDLASDYSKAPAEGGVYFGKNGHLYEVLLPDRTGTFRKNSDALKGFSKKTGISLYLLPVPSGSQEQPANLPDHAPNHNQREELEALRSGAGAGTKVVDVFDVLSLEKTGRDFYFRTDHHWNTDGAYEGYRALMGAMGVPCTPQSAFGYRAVSEPFYGTLYSKAIFPGQRADAMRLPFSKKSAPITQQTGAAIRRGIYWEEYLTQKDKYSVYLGGNPPVTVVRNPSAKDGKLLILKDSFANSMVPYLSTNFSEIHLIDLRYYNQDIYKYIKQNGITKAAAVYSIKQLCDVSIANKLA
jgi:hypothetical protein